jgi:urease accessory protein
VKKRRSFLRWPVALSGVLGLVFCPSDAAAHLVTTGMGPVYDGIGHLVMTPEDLIPVFTIALFAGQRGVLFGRRALFIFPLAWFVGGLWGVTLNGAPAFPVSALSFIVWGLFVATDLKISPTVFAALVILFGLVHGGLNGVALKDGPGVLGLVGILVALFVFVAITSSFVVSLQKNGARIAVRVVGSWVVAMGMLMLGWSVRGAA